MLYGSYFGDWDSTDNLLRASLATTNYTLASVWAGRPYWYFHHMALGETIGFSARLTQNNSATYWANRYPYRVHIALMGDPTLRLHPVAPPSALVVTQNGSGRAGLSWNPSPDSVAGYHVSRAPPAAGLFTRLTSRLITSTNYADAPADAATYMVRAVKLEASGSGTYWNASQGLFGEFVPRPLLGIIPLGQDAYRILGSGTPGRTYRIQFAEDLSAPDWRPVETVLADSSGAFALTNATTSSQRFYRALHP
jgi:hypothetical protein